jgi:hypothetical protein
MKKMPTITIKHSSDMKKTDANAYNKVQQKLRDNWIRFGYSAEEVEKMYPFVTLEHFTSKPGFYGKFGGSRSRGWEGPFKTEQQAKDVIGEIAYESTFG